MICSEFFFFKQKTAYELRISDWSSDVCSSDLGAEQRRRQGLRGDAARRQGRGGGRESALSGEGRIGIGRGVQDRKSVVSGKSVSVRVEHGGRRIIIKTQHLLLHALHSLHRQTVVNSVIHSLYSLPRL